MTSLRTLVALMLLVTPCQAQSNIAPARRSGPLDTFFRVAVSLGQERTVFAGSWPQPFTDGGLRSSLRLSAADRLVVHADAGVEPRDAVVRVIGVRLWRTVADTTHLEAMIAGMIQELTQRFGPAVECSDPLGAPSHLFMPQQVSRYWPRGVKGQPTRLSWTVSTEKLSDVELYAGRAARSDDLTMRCDARLP